MGGMSDEHEVSLNSGAGVVAALESTPYQAVPVLIARDGLWRFGAAPSIAIHEVPQRLRDFDCCFIALHGTFGEDGRVQGFLDMLGVPYTGSGCAASALAMDKVRCKAVVASQGIPVAGHVALDTATWQADRAAVLEAVRESVGYPCVIKPTYQGSSVGIEMPQEEAAFVAALERVLAVSDELLVEQFVSGTELTSSVLDAEPNGLIRPLPLTEIRPKSAKFFDYDAKYTPGATEEITPARIAPEMAEQVREYAAHVHEIVGCSGWSRSDFILGPEGPIWIEVNTVPGLTKTSLFPQACAAAGISYVQMVMVFVEDALRRHER
jgi:D-alanine-D-alanine ligase